MTSEPQSRDRPNFDNRAAEYDRAMPNFEPVTDALLGHLPEIGDGALVLDVACGTGEPGLTLARRAPGLQLLGIDNAPDMVELARHKAATEPVPNARFEVMEAQKLELAAGSAAAVISRLGLLLFVEPVAGVAEMTRVLAPGGRFSLAVWDRTDLNATLGLTVQTLQAVLPPDEIPDLGWMDALAAPGKREGWLRDAGVRSVNSELFRWTWNETDFAAVRKLMETGPLGPLFLKLGAEARARAYDYLEGLVAEYREPDGSYQIPTTCRLLWGQV